MSYQLLYPSHAPSALDSIRAPAPVCTVLIIGMVLFMASNLMPGLLPSPDKVFNIAPMVLQWAFVIVILALCVQMTGLLPGVPPVHITYVHLTIAFLLFFLLWNQIAADQPPPPPEAKPSSSSSSSAKKEEKKEERKKDEPKKVAVAEPTAWDDLRAHPSAFLTTRLNRLVPWPFPLGPAAETGPELWWESGTPSHVGHFNRPDPAAAQAAKDADEKKKKDKEKAKDKEKEKEKLKEKEKEEKEKEKEKEKAKVLAEKEAAEKAKKNEEEARRAKDAEKAKLVAAEAAKRKAAEDRQKQKLWRTRYLAMIIGISFLNKTFGFLLLLLFSIQLVSQELNDSHAGATAAAPVPAPSASASGSSGSSSSAARPSGSGGANPASGSSAAAAGADAEQAKEREKLAKMQAMKEAEKQREKEKENAKGGAEGAKSGSSSSRSASSDREKPSSSSSSSGSSSRSKSDSDTSSSKAKSDVVTSDAVREAAGTRTVTKPDEDAMGGVPYKPLIGMHYIHTRDANGNLDLDSNFIPSEEMGHPLMTSTWRGYANY